MAWELKEVPSNPTPSLQNPTVDVVAAKIEPKLASTLIRQLSQVCPLENLRHVKRVRRHTECGGKSDLSIILCLSTGSGICSKDFPEEIQKIVDTYQLSPFTAKVAKCSATSKEEWEEQCKLWPTSYHPAHELDVVRGFREEELPSIFEYMKTAIKLSKEGNAAIIVDPSRKQIIATATDQTTWHDTFEEGNKLAEAKDTCSLNVSTETDGNLFLSTSYISKCNGLNMEVSCINPWGWTKQQTPGQKSLACKGCFAWHPLQHAAMVAIENSAEGDRMLFTSSTTTTKPISNGHLENYPDNEPAKRLKTDATVSLVSCIFSLFILPLLAYCQLQLYMTGNDAYCFLTFSSDKFKIELQDKEQYADGACCSDFSETTRPYLCTGFDIYLVWEPCAMCAMALVHQRFKRVFYAFPNPITGALGGVYRLHGEKSLNHHYNVFRISVPDAFLNSLTEC